MVDGCITFSSTAFVIVFNSFDCSDALRFFQVLICRIQTATASACYLASLTHLLYEVDLPFSPTPVKFPGSIKDPDSHVFRQ